jgi:DNA mismatch endonuclease (patch repair protein)
MSRIRSRGNKDMEVALAKLFRRNKITGWRRHLKLRVTSGKRWVMGKRHTSPRPSPQRGEGGARVSSSSLVMRQAPLSVRPDFVFSKIRLALFVDGCFWHGCPKHGTQPKGNRTFWKNKFAHNIARDRLVTRALSRAGWRVLRIWEHELARKNEIRLIRRIQRVLPG